MRSKPRFGATTAAHSTNPSNGAKGVTSVTDEAAMWDAAPAAHARVAVAMLVAMLWLCTGATADGAVEAKHVATPIWAAELTKRQATELTFSRANELKSAGVNAVVIDRSRLDRQSRDEAQWVAQTWGMLVIDVSDRKTLSVCNRIFARAGKSACALVASSIKQGIAFARLPGKHLIIVRVKSAEDVRKLATVRSRGRFVALGRLGRNGFSMADWQTAVKLGSSAGLHLGAAAGTPTTTVSNYFASRAKVSAGAPGAAPTSVPRPTAAPAALPTAAGGSTVAKVPAIPGSTAIALRPVGASAVPLPASGNSGVANLFIDSDGGTCTRSSLASAYSNAAACASMTAAYQAASLGDLVYIKRGTYGDQTIAGALSKGQPDDDLSDITFRAAMGETVTLGSLIISVAHITLADVAMARASVRYRPEGADRAGDVHFDNVTAPGLIQFYDTWHFSITNSEIGPNNSGSDGVDVYGSPSGAGCQGHCPQLGLIENNDIHDLRMPEGSAAHVDGIQFAAGNDIVVRGNRIWNIEHQDMLLGVDAGPNYNNTIENNMFGSPFTPGFTLMIGTKPGVRCDGHIVRYNTFAGGPSPRTVESQKCSGKMYGNTVSSWFSSFHCSHWLTTWTLHNNVSEAGVTCGSNS